MTHEEKFKEIVSSTGLSFGPYKIAKNLSYYRESPVTEAFFDYWGNNKDEAKALKFSLFKWHNSVWRVYEFSRQDKATQKEYAEQQERLENENLSDREYNYWLRDIDQSLGDSPEYWSIRENLMTDLAGCYTIKEIRDCAAKYGYNDLDAVFRAQRSKELACGAA